MNETPSSVTSTSLRSTNDDPVAWLERNLDKACKTTPRTFQCGCPELQIDMAVASPKDFGDNSRVWGPMFSIKDDVYGCPDECAWCLGSHLGHGSMLGPIGHKRSHP